jgi:hypothetical protein
VRVGKGKGGKKGIEGGSEREAFFRVGLCRAIVGEARKKERARRAREGG